MKVAVLHPRESRSPPPPPPPQARAGGINFKRESPLKFEVSADVVLVSKLVVLVLIHKTILEIHVRNNFHLVSINKIGNSGHRLLAH